MMDSPDPECVGRRLPRQATWRAGGAKGALAHLSGSFSAVAADQLPGHGRGLKHTGSSSSSKGSTSSASSSIAGSSNAGSLRTTAAESELSPGQGQPEEDKPRPKVAAKRAKKALHVTGITQRNSVLEGSREGTEGGKGRNGKGAAKRRTVKEVSQGHTALLRESATAQAAQTSADVVTRAGVTPAGSSDTGTGNGAAATRRRGGILEQLLCGAFAGTVSRSAVAPVDLVRTHLISLHGMEGANKTAWGVVTSIVKRDGWAGLFRGNGVNCLRVAPNKAIELCTFEMLKRILCVPGHPLQHIAAPLSGGAAGMAGTIATYPLEVIRTRVSVQPDLYPGLIPAFKTMVKQEGIGSLYRGLPISLFGVFPYAATNYFVYDTLRGLYRRTTGREKIPTGATLAFGALAASVSSAVTFPLEVVRRRLQLGSIPGMGVPTSGLQVILQICEKEGWPAVYRGLGTTWLKLIPAAGISFVCYEAARSALRVDDASYATAALAPAPAGGASQGGQTANSLTLKKKASKAQLKAHKRLNLGDRIFSEHKVKTMEVSNEIGEEVRADMSSPHSVGSSDFAGLPHSNTRGPKCKAGHANPNKTPLRPAALHPPGEQGMREMLTLDTNLRGSGTAKTQSGSPIGNWASDFPPLPSPFGLGPAMLALRDGLESAEDLRLLRRQ